MSLTTGERLFPNPTTRAAMCRKTLVMWVIGDEQIPSICEFCSTSGKIQPYLTKKEGIRGETTLEVYLLNPKNQLSEANLKAYMDHDIVICTQGDDFTGGDEGERFHEMLLRILLSALDRERGQYNFLILSPNKDFAQCTNLSNVSLSLREMGIHIAVAHPDLFKDFECPEWDLCCC